MERNANTITVVETIITGATSKTTLSASLGTKCSFVANLKKSANAWKNPGRRNQYP